MPPKKKSPAQIKLPRGTIVPNHIAIILDGNGRWARSRGLPVTQGHEAGYQAIRSVLETARELGVHTLTVWGWSTENWKRPPQEVKKIMELVERSLKTELATAHQEKVRFTHLGRKDRLPKPLVKLIKKAEAETKAYTKYQFNLALDYGGQDEITRAVKKIIQDNVPAEKIDEKLFASYLDTADQRYPYPDLFIRTSGEQRTSGLLPWQLTYAEFYFEQDHLPDMTPEKLRAIILDYSRRRRRFGAKDRITHFKFKPELTARLELAWWRLANIPEDKSFREYALQHIQEQWGLSKSLAKEAAILMAEALREGKAENWVRAGSRLRQFYRLIKDEVKLAFEPSLAASLEIKLLQRINGGSQVINQAEVEDTTRRLISEVYRISDFQAKKAAHLRSLAAVERNLAERGEGEHHWDRAEDYLKDYYRALKDRVA
jgi:undecaprenyl diphosphate synthase